MTMTPSSSNNNPDNGSNEKGGTVVIGAPPVAPPIGHSDPVASNHTAGSSRRARPTQEETLRIKNKQQQQQEQEEENEQDDDVIMLEEALEAEEDRMMMMTATNNTRSANDDEEIASYDELGRPVVDTEQLDRRNLTVTLVKSVVEQTTKKPLDESDNDDDNNGDRRDEDAVAVIAAAAATAAAAAAAVGSRHTNNNKRPLGPRPRSFPNTFGRTSVVIPTPSSSSGTRPLLPPSKVITPLVKPKPLTKVSVVQPKRPFVSSLSKKNPSNTLQSTSSTTTITTTTTLSRQPLHAAQSPLPQVPNPLANLDSASATTATTQSSSSSAPTASSSIAATPSSSSSSSSYHSVPCPLLPPIQTPPTAQTEAKPDVPLSSSSQVKPAATAATITSSNNTPSTESTPAVGRGRIFSIDIDPAGLDFTDLTMDNITSSDYSSGALLPPITTSGPVVLRQQQQQQAAPIAPANPQPAPVPSDMVAGRDRAMSFEFFSFGINADEPLPPVPTDGGPSTAAVAVAAAAAAATPEAAATSVVNRPRGDSIIFDPISFQDGGIHEEKALMKSRTNSIDMVLPGSEEMAIMNTPGFTPNPASSSASVVVPANPSAALKGDVVVDVQVKPQVVPSFAPTTAIPKDGKIAVVSSNNNNTTQMATLPSSLNTTMNHATFQMDLLNKDGRIGIYLPQERKARIAKFHSKRKMRIWRKRIKYDCRKKLADSRPRIKGRFVKRSDMMTMMTTMMEDEEV